MPPSNRDETGVPPESVERSQAEMADLQRTIAGMPEQAEVLGVEAELGAARARIAELEGRLHVRIVEVLELRNEIERLEAQPLVEPRVRPAMK